MINDTLYSIVFLSKIPIVFDLTRNSKLSNPHQALPNIPSAILYFLNAMTNPYMGRYENINTHISDGRLSRNSCRLSLSNRFFLYTVFLFSFTFTITHSSLFQKNSVNDACRIGTCSIVKRRKCVIPHTGNQVILI